MSTKRVASATSLAPQARKNSLPPPNVPVPKLNTGTFKPDLPSCRNSMCNRCSSPGWGCGYLPLKMLPERENSKPEENGASTKRDQRDALYTLLSRGDFGQLVSQVRSDLDQRGRYTRNCRFVYAPKNRLQR